MKLKNFKAIILTLVLGLIASGCDRGNSDDPANSNTRQSSSSLERVLAGPPIRQTLELFSEQPGQVTPFQETPILAKVAGYVESVTVDVGDQVTRGQPLIKIAAPEYVAQVEQKQGRLEQVRAEIKQAEAALIAAQAGVQSAAAMVAQAQAGMGRAEAEYNRWNSEYQRIQQLVANATVTAKLADETASQLQAAEASLKEMSAMIESARARQREAEARENSAEADIEVAKSQVTVAQADVNHAQAMLSYTRLLAPFDGVVTSRKVDEGHFVQPASSEGRSNLLTIASIAKVRVAVDLPEQEAIYVDAGYDDPDSGDPVTIFSSALPNGRLETRLTRTSEKLDTQSRSLTVFIDLDNRDYRLRPGGFVNVRIELERRPDVLTLPIAAIVRQESGTYCYQLIDGKVVATPLVLGLRAGEVVEIISGLTGSETIVLARANSLQPGQAVEVIGSQ